MTQKKLPKAVRPEEFVKLMKAVRPDDKQAKIAFIISYYAGLRISEVTALKPENIKDRTIEVWDGKGGRDRVAPRPKAWKDWMTKLLPIKKTNRSLQRNFISAAKKAKLPSFYTFHSLRHGFATRAVEQGIPLSHIQAMLGHSNISTTSVYTKARPVDALKSFEELF